MLIQQDNIYKNKGEKTYAKKNLVIFLTILVNTTMMQYNHLGLNTERKKKSRLSSGNKEKSVELFFQICVIRERKVFFQS